MSQNQIDVGDHVSTRVGTGVVIHPKDNPQDDETGLYRSDSEFIHVLLDKPFSQPALHEQTWTSVYAVQRRENVQFVSKGKPQ